MSFKRQIQTITDRLLDSINTNISTISTSTTSSSTASENTRDNIRLTLGNDGVKIVSGAAAQSETTGTYFAVQFIKATTPSTFTATNSTLVTGQEYPAGTIIYADILTITGDSSGMYALYKGNPA